MSDTGNEPGEMVAEIAAAIGEPSRAKILFSLLDGRALTSTELATIADVSPSTTSAHLSRLAATGLVLVSAQGRHRYYRLAGKDVAKVLEDLSVLAGAPTNQRVVSRVPHRLRAARTCYDHLAGALGVALLDRFIDLKWLASDRPLEGYSVTADGEREFDALGLDVAAARGLRRKFACACLDWSERRPHLAGALGSALLDMALGRRWVVQDLDSRALAVTRRGRSELSSRLGLELETERI